MEIFLTVFKQRRNHQDNLQNVDRNVDSPENVGDIFYNNVQNEGQGKDAGKFLIKKLVKLYYVNSPYTHDMLVCTDAANNDS